MRRQAIDTLITIMSLYDEYEKLNGGYTDGVGEYIRKKINMSNSHIFAMRYYGNNLKRAGYYEIAVRERWGLVKIRNFVNEFRVRTSTCSTYIEEDDL